jgi:hypothetical protein
VPDFIFGEPNYDQGECLGFIITKLEENGFFTNYMHPNTLFVSWENWIPSYTRNEIKKKMGVVLDEKGNIIERLDENQMGDESVTGGIKVTGQKKDSRQFTPIEKYKPTGNLVYHPEMFEKLEKKVSFSPGV